MNVAKTIEQLNTKSEPGANGCILWTGRVNVLGYRRLLFKGKDSFAHRALITNKWCYQECM